MNREKIQTVLIIFLVFLVGFLIGTLAFDPAIGGLIAKWRTSDSTEIDEIIEDCNRTSLYSSMLCLNSYIIKNYKYRVTRFTLSPEETLELGGDCKSYSNFYFSLAQQLNYNAKLIKIKTGNRRYHQFAIVSGGGDDTPTYCLMDMLEIECFFLKGVEDEK